MVNSVVSCYGYTYVRVVVCIGALCLLVIWDCGLIMFICLVYMFVI